MNTEKSNRLILACDQYKNRVVLYDMNKAIVDGDLDSAETAEFDTGRTASIKYREGTVWGDVIITVSYKYGPMIISYPSGKLLWMRGADDWLGNPHSVELLPSGNMVYAASGGSVRIYNNANVIRNGDKLTYESYELAEAHGVLYDPKRNYVWALGCFELVAYEIVDNGDGTESLKRVDGVGARLEAPAKGHDLAVDLTDSRYLWLTAATGVLRFDKQTNCLESSFEDSDKLSLAHLKGFGNNRANEFVFCYPNGGIGREWESHFAAKWSTDTIFYAYREKDGEFTVKPCVSKSSAFYKVRVLDGKYE